LIAYLDLSLTCKGLKIVSQQIYNLGDVSEEGGGDWLGFTCQDVLLT